MYLSPVLFLFRDTYQKSGLIPRRPVNNKHIYRIERRRMKEAQARAEAQAREQGGELQEEDAGHAEVVQTIEADLSKPFTFVLTNDGKVVQTGNENPSVIEAIDSKQYFQVIRQLFAIHMEVVK